MSTENTGAQAAPPADAPAASAPAATTPPAAPPAAPPPAAPAAPATPPAQPETFTRQYVEDLRREAAGYRTRANDAEAKVVTLETTAKTATETAQVALLKATVVSKATELKIVDADAALALMDRSGVKIEGETVSGVSEALTALIAAKPYLVGAAQQTPTPQTNPARAAVKYSKEQIEQMTPAEINADWDNVNASLASFK